MCVARGESSSQGLIRGDREAVMGGLGCGPWAAPEKVYGSILQSLTLSVILPESLVSVWVSMHSLDLFESLPNVLGEMHG